MLATKNDLLMGRLDILEQGVTTLDSRVASLDDKVTHVIQMNSELLIQSNENFRHVKAALEDQRQDLKKSIRQIRGSFSTRCQLIGFALVLSSWTLFMAWVMWA